MNRELLIQALQQNPEIIKKVRVQRKTTKDEYYTTMMTSDFIEYCLTRELTEYLKKEGLLHFENYMTDDCVTSVCELLIIDKEKLNNN